MTAYALVMTTDSPTVGTATVAIIVGLLVLIAFVAFGWRRRASSHRMWPWAVVGFPLGYIAFIVTAIFTTGT
jgi:hypothetical protein